MTNRGPDAGGATSNSSADPGLAGRCTRGKFDAALPGSPCRRDLPGHSNYGSRDGHDHRFEPELPLEDGALP